MIRALLSKGDEIVIGQYVQQQVFARQSQESDMQGYHHS